MEEAAEDMNRLVDDAKEDEDKEDFEMHMEEAMGMDRLASSGSNMEMDLEEGVNLEGDVVLSFILNLTKRVMRNTERKKKKRQKATWPGLGMRKVATMATRMARLQVRLNTRLPRSQNRVENFKSKGCQSVLTILYC